MIINFIDDQIKDLQALIPVQEVIFSGKSQFQEILVFENPTLGTVLALDGTIQLAQIDEFIYHEMLCHVPMHCVERPQQALIVGGGDCCAARELLRYPGLSLDLVEIDELLYKTACEHLWHISRKPWQNARLKVHIGDGAAFVSQRKSKYDIIVVDTSDPLGPSEILFTEHFYRHCALALKPGGVLVTQAGIPQFHLERLRFVVSSFSRMFENVGLYFASVPTYVSGAVAFCCGTNGVSCREPERRQFDLAALRYYNEEVHKSSFALPNYLQDL